ncbi:MAG: competence/damage-inducible protein A [Limisphaerales bacterium]
MNIEIINTGSELLLGRVLNTHQHWLGRQLADAGYEVARQVAIADTGEAIQAAVSEAMERARLIIVTGGLGPTSDDITRDKIAELLETDLHEDPEVVEHVRGFFTRRQRPMPDSTRVQAMIPDGAEVIMNAHGTAPGLVIPAGESWLIMLPGPPRELRPMFTNQILPLIHERFPRAGGFACTTLKSTGLGESLMEDLLKEPLRELEEQGLVIGFCARVGEVDLRLSATGPSSQALVDQAETIAREVAAKYFYGMEDETLEQTIVALLSSRGKTLALAESCTGGYLGHRITNISGASAVLLCGMVTYSNEAKQKLLGVNEATLAAHGAVSEAVAHEMAAGALRESGADYALSVSGIAGPTGGTDEKPVGTVYVGLASRDGTIVKHRINAFDRETFKFVTAQQAFELLRREVLGIDE